MENHAEEEPELCIGQKLGMIYCLHIDKEAGLRSELRKDKKLKVYEEDEGADQDTVNSVQESDYQQRKVKESLCKRFSR